MNLKEDFGIAHRCRKLSGGGLDSRLSAKGKQVYVPSGRIIAKLII